MEPDQGIAVSLSGGGIRAAAFGLGLLRALEEASLLHHIDHLSSVSGGGYTATAWATEVLSQPDRSMGALAEARQNVKDRMRDHADVYIRGHFGLFNVVSLAITAGGIADWRGA